MLLQQRLSMDSSTLFKDALDAHQASNFSLALDKYKSLVEDKALFQSLVLLIANPFV